ncbi:hypothetical protein [Plebeiibacterium sediminum]|uniref:Secreted protein n=1 Tax=Plebeiibacterium sediminum TaxID=2992112 RepID=A0AAE3SDY0_9BACT|nr:hypothetical protein [Plebeiobacterium sediminum]MCW3785745.1 hypothetical protein [Plebeiobacterium sediminum]
MKFSIKKNCLVVSLSVVIVSAMLAIAPINICDINNSDEFNSCETEEHNENNSEISSKNVGLSVGNQFLVRL